MKDAGNMWQEKDSLSKLGNLWGPGRVAVLYLIGLVGCICAGLAAPDLFISKTSTFSPADPEALARSSGFYEFAISDYERSHQSVYFSMRLNLPIQLQQAMDLNGQRSFETEGRYTVSLYGSQQPSLASDDCPNGCLSCPGGDDALDLTCELVSADSTGDGTISCERGDDWCTWLSLYSLNFVQHKTYYWAVEAENDIDEYIESANPSSNAEDWVPEFRVVFVSRRYTGFQLGWFYSWLLITLLVMFLPRHGFFTLAIAGGVRVSKWSRLQKWAAVLLVGLFFFNNPFFAAQIYSSSPKPSFIWYALVQGMFVSLLLLFWADRTLEDGMGNNDSRSRRNGATARGAGVVLALLLCVVYIVNMIDIRISRDGSPDRVHKYPYTSTATERMLTILCLIYCFWIIVLAGRAWWWGGGTVSEKLRSSRRVQFFVVASLMTMLLLLPAIILEHLQPRVRGGVAFTLAHGGVNLFVLALALLCAPRHADDKTGEDDDDIATVGTTVNPIAHQRAVEVVDQQGPGSKGSSGGKWWTGTGKGKQRPKIRDSSAWEDEVAVEL